MLSDEIDNPPNVGPALQPAVAQVKVRVQPVPLEHIALLKHDRLSAFPSSEQTLTPALRNIAIVGATTAVAGGAAINAIRFKFLYRFIFVFSPIFFMIFRISKTFNLSFVTSTWPLSFFNTSYFIP